MTGILSSLLNGANKFSTEVLAPTTGLGKLGAYLSAAAGNDLGTATLAYQKDQREQEGAGLEQKLRMLQIQKALLPQQPGNDYERIVARLGQGAADNYLTSLAAGPPMAVDAVDPTTHQTVRQYIPRTQLPGIGGQQSQNAPAGITFTPIDGGQTQPASGGFRR